MKHAKLERMDGKKGDIGDFSGVWQVVIEDSGDKAVPDPNPRRSVYRKNLTHEEGQAALNEWYKENNS